MKKIFISLLTIFTGLSGHSATIHSVGGELYQGSELVNEKATGKTCYLYLDTVEANPVGLHCYKLTTRPVFTTDRANLPQDEIVVLGRITNYHRSEYPQLKTCAMNLRGQTSENDIYGNDDATLYNQLFSWQGKQGATQFDFFVTYSPVTKTPIRTRMHKMNRMSETDYDCVNLQKI